jgi:hypothetical protein
MHGSAIRSDEFDFNSVEFSSRHVILIERDPRDPDETRSLAYALTCRMRPSLAVVASTQDADSHCQVVGDTNIVEPHSPAPETINAALPRWPGVLNS